MEVAERVREAICGRPLLVGISPRGEAMTASFGIASFPLHARTKEELVQRADRAMQSVKSTTKNAIAVAERRRDADGS
jgi:GGDEF domain-containing protein